jgi:hypothetical protein
VTFADQSIRGRETDCAGNAREKSSTGCDQVAVQLYSAVSVATSCPRGSDFERKKEKKNPDFFFLKYEPFPTHFSGTAAPQYIIYYLYIYNIKCERV